MNKIDVNEIEGYNNDKYDQIQTGDVILMSSITPFAIVVKWSICSEYNHVSIAVRIDKDYLPNIKVVKRGGMLCLIEFNGDLIKNVLTGKNHKGNRLVVFNDIIDKYKRLSFRKLDRIHYTDQFERKVEDFIYKYCNHVTEMDVMTPILCILGLQLNIDEYNNHPEFCSELAAKFYGDLIPGSIKDPYKSLLPPHFAGKKYNNLFSSDVRDLKNEPHAVMDFFHSVYFWIIIAIILIILFIYCTKKVYTYYCRNGVCVITKKL
jgi:hypothetical protein